MFAHIQPYCISPFFCSSINNADILEIKMNINRVFITYKGGEFFLKTCRGETKISNLPALSIFSRRGE